MGKRNNHKGAEVEEAMTETKTTKVRAPEVRVGHGKVHLVGPNGRTKCNKQIFETWSESDGAITCVSCAGNHKPWGGHKYAAGHYGISGKTWN